MRITSKKGAAIVALTVTLFASSFSFYNGFTTTTTISSSSAAEAAFRSTSTKFRTSNKSARTNLLASFVRVPQSTQSSFRTMSERKWKKTITTAALASPLSLSSSLSLLSLSNEDNDVPDKEESVTNRSNWRTIVDGNIRLRQGKDFISDLSYGLAHVHRNCIQIYWEYIFKRTILLVLVFAIPLLIFPFFQPTVRIAISTQKILLGTLTQISSLTQKIVLPIKIPIRLLMKSKVLIQHMMNPKAFIKLLCDLIMKKPTGNGFDSISGMPISVLLLSAILKGPIMEEIIFRFEFDKIWHFVSRIIGGCIPRKSNNKTEVDEVDNQKHRSSKSRLWLGHQPWILVSSICFGLSHLSNLLPLNPETVRSIIATYFADTNDMWVNFYIQSLFLLGAIFQWILTTSLALEVLGPLYCKQGLGASIGAHIMYNLNTVLFVPSIGGRLLIRFFRKVLTSAFGTNIRLIDRFQKKKDSIE